MSDPAVLLSQLIGKGSDKLSEGLYTAIPATVVSVVDGFRGMLINAKPKLLIKNGDGTTAERQTILNVPVQMPATRRSAITMPVAAGDDVLLIFSMEGIDSWKRHFSTSPIEPLDYRRHSMRDAYAITGVFPISGSVNQQNNRSLPHNTNDLVVSHNLKSGSETEIRLLSGGGIIVNTSQDIVANCNNLTANTTTTEVNATTATVNATTVEVNSSDFTVNSDTATINSSSLTLAAGSISAGGGGGGGTNAVWQGDMIINGSLVVNGINFSSHLHGGVQGGSSDTGAPK